MSLKEKLKSVLDSMNAIRAVFNSNIDWEVKYDVIFKEYQTNLSKALSELGCNLEWYDPDTSYEDDVRAFYNAMNYLQKDLGVIYESC